MTRKRHIVIVDDEANIGRSLRLILEGEGYRVSVFDSTSAFLAERNRAAPTCICSTCGSPMAAASTCCGWCGSGTSDPPP